MEAEPLEDESVVNEVTQQRKDGAVQEGLLHSATTVCVCLRSVSPSSHRDNPQAFLWVYEGLVVACGPLEEEADSEQQSSDCSSGAAPLY